MGNAYKYSDITDKVIRAFYNVYNKLGYGFLEKVYERAMVIELRKMVLQVIVRFLSLCTMMEKTLVVILPMFW